MSLRIALRDTALITLGVALVTAGFVALAPDQADAAPREVLRYVAAEHPRDIGDWPSKTIVLDATWANKRWPVERVAAQLSKETGLNVRVCRAKRDLPNYTPCGDVTISSDRSNHTGPTGKRLGEVSIWSTNGVINAADVSLDDRDGKKASKTNRERKLRGYVRDAIGR